MEGLLVIASAFFSKVNCYEFKTELTRICGQSSLQWWRQPQCSRGDKTKFLGHTLLSTKKRPYTNKESQFITEGNAHD